MPDHVKVYPSDYSRHLSVENGDVVRMTLTEFITIGYDVSPVRLIGGTTWMNYHQRSITRSNQQVSLQRRNRKGVLLSSRRFALTTVVEVFINDTVQEYLERKKL